MGLTIHPAFLPLIFLAGGMFCVAATFFIVPAILPAYDIPVLNYAERSTLYQLIRDFDHAVRISGADYSVVSGVLLGLERHGDIIPWDDDMDVFMNEPDANALFAVGSPGRRYLESRGCVLSQATNIWRVYRADFNRVFVDIMPAWKTTEGNWVPISIQTRMMWPNMFLTEDEMRSVQDRRLGPVVVRAPCPKHARNCIVREYGREWCRCKIVGSHTFKAQRFHACGAG